MAGTALDRVDPELRAALALFPDFASVSAATLPGLRELVQNGAAAQLDAIDATGVKIEQVQVPRGDGTSLRLVIYAPADGAKDATLLHFHGGGMMMGLPEMRHGWLVRTARDCRCKIVSVDYRLAPEYPFPAAFDDGITALKWLAAQHTSPLLISGESAGGGIAAGVVQAARDMNISVVAGQLLTYPMLDDRGVNEPINDAFGQFVWSAAANRFAWQSLLGGKDVTAYAAPGRQENLKGLPPTFIGVGALDLFLKDNLAYAQRLAAAAVPVDLHVYPGAYHGFDAVQDAEISRSFAADWRRAFRRFLGVSG